ncbi:MAG: hypothetical protein K8T90_10005 [Planctomycetes bacterium]|nr:hypothetical protein [Planctomycetota bacterium]
MRRITVAIEDDILRDLKQQAARDGVTMRDLVNRLLRRGLRESRRGVFRFHLTTVKGRLRKCADLDDTSALLDRMDGRR